MKFPSGFGRLLLLTLSCLGLVGCSPFRDDTSEEKNALIQDALAKKQAYNFQGAIHSLEKALEGNPRLARAHWELGLIYYQNVKDPAAAIYHFQRLLRIQPDWRLAGTARQLINESKIELAKNVPLGPQSVALQQQMDRLTAKVHELTSEADRLRQVNQSLQMQLQQAAIENVQLKERLRVALAMPPAAAPGPTNPAGPGAGTAPPGTPQSTSGPGGGAPPSAVTPAASPPALRADTGRADPTSAPPRTHTVRRGETLSSIANRYGVKLRALTQANPRINPDRLKEGQVLRLPER